MPTIQVRDLPDHIYLALKSAASQERRSLSQQIIVSLAKALGVEVDHKARRKKVLTKIDAEADKYAQYADVDVVDWIREDREER